MYEKIDQQRSEHSVTELCMIYGVSRTGFYKWKQRQQRNQVNQVNRVNRYERAHRHLDFCVSDIHAHNPMMGYRAIRDKLALEFGLKVSDPSVWKSMRRLPKKPKAPVLIHSDQGPQYAAAGYTHLLSEYHITQSMSRAGTPRDNAVMESFLGRFKDTLRFHFRYWERKDLRAVVAECMHYFNYDRPIRKCKGLPPIFSPPPAA